ncbi:MAG: PAS domain-containing protein [Caulobacterales bacterium]|nr:PAS domain-containing protein [Caulobacterales bacterium]
MSSSEELKAEVARLSARVAELETELAAKPPIDRASLYRMVNNAPWGVLVINRNGRLEFANAALQRWLKLPAPAVEASQADAVAPALLAVLQAPLAAAFAGQAHEAEFSLRDVGGELRDVRVTVMPRGSGAAGVTGAAVSVYDVTETQALDRSVRENEARLRQINAVTPSANYIFDFETGAAAWVGGRTDAVYDHSIEELTQGGPEFIRALIHPDDLAKIPARLAELAARPDGDVVEFELRVRWRNGVYRWILDRAVVFERDGSGRILKTLSAAIDIDERKRAEERRSLLINELNHRVKNTLAAVQSIARQTLRSDRPADQTLELFNARLVALSAAHNILTRENWEGAGLREIVAGALSPFEAQGRIFVEGPDVRLSAHAAVALAMALHELATNAVKYGALSADAGEVRLAWRVGRAGGSGRLELEWREQGGPPVQAPRLRGFGSRLLTQGLPAELDGVAELEFAPQGVVCRISAPLEVTPRLELA